jgi:hypothetical protein
MRRLNVRFSQIEECIRTSMFAVDMLPANPPMHKGEELLLQLVSADAAVHKMVDQRIQFALIFDRAVSDATGAISREHWPHAGKTWKYILFCSETVPCIPFSLEHLGMTRYAGQTNPMYIQPEDAARIRPYLKGETRPEGLTSIASVEQLLITLHNYDRVVTQEPQRTVRVSEHTRRLQDPWLGDTLKSLYHHRCQICSMDFKPRYGVPYADTRFITPVSDGGPPISRNTVVICPNHNAIIDATRAHFDWKTLAYEYPNGLVEALTLSDHLLS